MARKIYLDNDWSIRRTDIESLGVGVPDGVAVRGLLAATPDGLAIDPTLEVAGTTLNMAFTATVQGFDLTDHLLALWDAAQTAGVKLLVYEQVIIDTADYHDVTPLQVERDRPPTEPVEAE